MTKKLTKHYGVFLAVFITLCYSCQKSGVTNSNDKTTTTVSAISNSQAILVSSASTTSTSSTDAVYLIHAYPAGLTVDSVTLASLPTTIGTYLTANYSGYTFSKAYQVLTSTGTVDSYVVVIVFNGKPVGLKFDATGTFVKVLEQCEGHDLGSSLPWHIGGRFDFRDGKQRDTVAISALPTAITLYFTSYYPKDTLLHATINADGSYLIISTDKGLYATSVTSLGSFIKRTAIYPHPNNRAIVLETALLPAITAYLTATYPGYVFDKAFAEQSGTTVLAYDVFVNVNGTHYAVEFDAAGKYVKSIAIR